MLGNVCVFFLRSLLGLYLQQILLLDGQLFVSAIRQPARVAPAAHLSAWSAEEADALLKGEYQQVGLFSVI